ncbi:MAG: hypothetical protein ACKO6B_04845 [Planctomycetia bacterium]
MAIDPPASFRLLLCAAFACGCLRVVAADPQVADPPVEAAQAAAEEAAPPPAEEQPLPLRTIHRQVSRLPFNREFRVVPVGDAATVEAYEKIGEALQRPLEAQMTFAETPLRDVVETFRETLGVPVLVDRRAFEDAGIDLDLLITFKSHGTTARAALRHILGALDLGWIIRDESLVITTKDAAAQVADVRLYPLPLSSCTQPVADLRSLVELVQNAVAPQTWNTVGGEGSIQPCGDGAATGLLVRQTMEAHAEVEGLLRGLHERELAEFDAAGDGSGAGAPTVRVYQVADEATRDDLARKLVELCNDALPQGRDPRARVTVVGGSLAVHAATPEFHALAGQLIRAVAGEQVLDGWRGGANAAAAAGMGGMF